MAVSDQITRLENEIAAQEALISEILSTLEGKASSGFGENIPYTITINSECVIDYIIYDVLSNNKVITYYKRVGASGTTLTNALIGHSVLVMTIPIWAANCSIPSDFGNVIKNDGQSAGGTMVAFRALPGAENIEGLYVDIIDRD